METTVSPGDPEEVIKSEFGIAFVIINLLACVVLPTAATEQEDLQHLYNLIIHFKYGSAISTWQIL